MLSKPFVMEKVVIAQKEEYVIQNQNVVNLVSQFGSPLYVYNGRKIIQQIESLKQAFSKDILVEIKYAAKALPNPYILKLIKSQGIGLDTVSPQELELGLKVGFDASEITFTPSGVSWCEIEYAVESGVLVTLDNLSVLEKFGRQYGNSKPCMIRIRPNVKSNTDAKSGNTSVGDKKSKFGIDINQQKEILALVAQYNMNVIGLHQHTGSGIKDTKSIMLAAKILFEFGLKFENLQIIDLGGGFKVAYGPNETGIDLTKFGREISDKFKAFSQEYNERYKQERKLRLWFEPGKYIVAESGYLLVTATAVKRNLRKQTFVCVDSGLNHLIRPMFYDAYHHITNVSNVDDEQSEIYNIVGYICETDTFAKKRSLNQVSEGHILAIHNAGAYGFAMASNYCSRLRPAEVLIDNNQAKLIRKRETLSDLLPDDIE